MKIQKIKNKTEYQQLWKEANLSVLQSWEWGEVKSTDWKPVRFRYGDIPFTILLRKIPLVNKWFGYMPRAFSNLIMKERFEMLQDLLITLREYIRDELKLTHLLIDPNIGMERLELEGNINGWAAKKDISDGVQQNTFGGLKELKKPEDIEESNRVVVEKSNKNLLDVGQKLFTSAGFQSDGITIQPNQSNVIDLEKSKEDLFMSLSSSTRNRIRKAKKVGKCSVIKYEYDSVKELSSAIGDIDDNKVVNVDSGNGQTPVDILYEQLKNVAERTGFDIHPKAYFQRIWDELGPSRMVAIFVVYLNKGDKSARGVDVGGLGDAVGASLRVYGQDGVYALYSGVTNIGLKEKAGYLLQWVSINDAQDLGKKWFDQWGVAPMLDGEFVKSHELYGVSLYKKGFGKSYYEFLPQQKLLFSFLWYAVYKWGRWLYRLVKSL